jgi:hypothetical protein
MVPVGSDPAATIGRQPENKRGAVRNAAQSSWLISGQNLSYASESLANVRGGLMNSLNRTTLAAALIAGGVSTLAGSADAVPLGGASLSLRDASTPVVQTVQWRRRGWGWGGFGVGLATGAIIGGAIAASTYPAYSYGYPAYGGYAPAYGYGYAPAYYGGYAPAYYGYSYAYPRYRTVYVRRAWRSW